MASAGEACGARGSSRWFRTWDGGGVDGGQAFTETSLRKKKRLGVVPVSNNW